jgi:hypothetical protein
MNEKTASEAMPLLRDRFHQRPRRSNISTVLGLLAAVCLIGFFHHRPHPAPNDIEEPTEKPWTWNDIKPRRDLRWESCYEKFECARLDVPMDWLKPSDSKRVVLGVIKLPAKSKNNTVSPLFVNPGVWPHLLLVTCHIY